MPTKLGSLSLFLKKVLYHLNDPVVVEETNSEYLRGLRDAYSIVLDYCTTEESLTRRRRVHRLP
jgi:hypothetical protein